MKDCYGVSLRSGRESGMRGLTAPGGGVLQRVSLMVQHFHYVALNVQRHIR